MELFPDGGFVRLQSRATSKYVHADGDWDSVSLRALGHGGTVASSLEAVWRVEHLAIDDHGDLAFRLLLQNTAYGRYLSCSHLRVRPGHRGTRAVQDDRTEPPNNNHNAFPWWWRVQRVDPDQNYVRLLFATTDLGLRANGRYRRWNTGVTIDINRRRGLTTMMQWTVHVVPVSAVPIAPPVAPPQPQQIQRGRHRLLFWRRTGNRDPQVHQHPRRTIRYVRASDEGHFDQDHRHWPMFFSYDNSVINLRTQLGQLQADWDGDMLRFTLCIRPGFHGRLMPLVTDLPRSLHPINIVVLRTGSAAAEALEYPQIAALAQ